MNVKKLLGWLAFFAAMFAVFYFIFLPVIKDVATVTEREKITGVVRNAVSVYMYDDIDHVAHPRDLAVVFGEYIAYVKDNDTKEGEYVKHDPMPTKVSFAGPCEGVYVSGTYIRREEDYAYVVKLSEGDSIDGLYEAFVPDIPELKGYVYYGTLEKCDVYEKVGR